MSDQTAPVSELEQTFERRTASRRAVLEAIVSWQGLFSAEDLRRALPRVSRATIYRSLASLRQEGALCRVMVDNGAPRYQLGGTRHHHHLLCMECGEVRDISGCGVDDFVRSVGARFGYETIAHRLEIYGRCAACH